MKLDRNSYGSIGLVWVLALALVLLLIWTSCSLWVVVPVTILLSAFCCFVTFFFRVPRRNLVGSGSVVTAVADGKVVILKKVFEPDFIKGECIQLSIYMDFFDVHANFWPVSGEVLDYKYYPGKHFLAFKPKASEENEHTASLVRSESGHLLLFKQLAGGFARRIVCYSIPGMKIRAGEQCGVIKFGSRIDMYLPLEADIKVSIGDNVRACETIVAVLR